MDFPRLESTPYGRHRAKPGDAAYLERGHELVPCTVERVGLPEQPRAVVCRLADGTTETHAYAWVIPAGAIYYRSGSFPGLFARPYHWEGLPPGVWSCDHMGLTNYTILEAP